MPAHHKDGYKHAWLIEELTHVWMYQQQGWGYLWELLSWQRNNFKNDIDIYDESALGQSRKQGKRLRDFSLMTQAPILGAFYLRHQRRQDTSAYAPYIADIGGGAVGK